VKRPRPTPYRPLNLWWDRALMGIIFVLALASLIGCIWLNGDPAILDPFGGP